MRPPEYEDRLKAPFSISQSGLKQFLRDPQAFKAGAQPLKDSSALFHGTLADALLLGDIKQCARYVLSPFDAYRSNEAKAWKTAQVQAGRLPVKLDDVIGDIQSSMEACSNRGLASLLYGTNAGRMAELAVLLARQELSFEDFGKAAAECLDGKAQQAIWTSVLVDVDGVEVKIRCGGIIDFLKNNSPVVYDMKTTSAFDPVDYMASAFKFGYHIQAAWYLRAARLLDPNINTFAHLLVELGGLGRSVELPFAEGLIDVGERVIAAGLRHFARCSLRNEWPSPWDSVSEITVPRWKLEKLETDYGRDMLARESLGAFRNA